MYCNSLTNITIPENVSVIEHDVFWHCTSLKSVIIPESVTSIGGYAFADCDNLTINRRAESQPSGWDSDWNYSDCPVNWGYTGE